MKIVTISALILVALGAYAAEDQATDEVDWDCIQLAQSIEAEFDRRADEFQQELDDLKARTEAAEQRAAALEERVYAEQEVETQQQQQQQQQNQLKRSQLEDLQQLLEEDYERSQSEEPSDK